MSRAPPLPPPGRLLMSARTWAEGTVSSRATANLRSTILDFRGFDSDIICKILIYIVCVFLKRGPHINVIHGMYYVCYDMCSYYHYHY